jgi:5-methylcytosine-specific restriction protein B
MEESNLQRWVNAIERKGQAIIYGPPGTGKTFVAQKLALHLIAGGDGFSDVVQFHPAYAYEDFIQGIRPRAGTDGRLDYPLVRGRFLEFCERAAMCKDRCVLIIDEINRANLARVFGELMYLMEYRGAHVPLAGGGSLRIPPNVRIIGTMNTADRSIALVDHALRRRFAFLALYPNYDVLKRFHENHKTGFPVDKLIQKLTVLNRTINDRHYEVGISYFLRDDLYTQIEDIWRMEIEPYLDEYFYDQPGKAKDWGWDKIGGEILA